MRINEIFYSIQGEGKTIGHPRLFIRLSGCTLNCSFCDSKYHIRNTNYDLLKDEVLTKYQNLNTGERTPIYDKWCITGGEPLLQQDEIIKLIRIYKPSWVEIETNGTLPAKPELKKLVNLFNISPKQQDEQEDGRKTDVKIFSTNKLLPMKDYVVKFVYGNNSDEFIKSTIKKHKLPLDKIYIMPKGKTKVEQERQMPKAIDFALKNNFNLSPRIQVLVWNKKRSV